MISHICGRAFIQSSDLKKHRTHTGKRPYNCDTCGMEITQYIYTVEKPYKGDTCEIAFTQAI